MKIWISSDQHFGHAKIIDHAKRNFNSTHDMGQELLEQINRNVGVNDLFYILGDFTITNRLGLIEYYRSQIKCKDVRMILGNHDNAEKTAKAFGKSKTSMMERRKLGGVPVVMCHYPLATVFRRTLMLYGHCHGNYFGGPNSMDVGVDVAFRIFGKYRPFNLDEIVKLIKVKNRRLEKGGNTFILKAG